MNETIQKVLGPTRVGLEERRQGEKEHSSRQGRREQETEPQEEEEDQADSVDLSGAAPAIRRAIPSLRLLEAAMAVCQFSRWTGTRRGMGVENLLRCARAVPGGHFLELDRTVSNPSRIAWL
ncbi:MAG: hypothetical protein HY319_14770 [Armatimonadetes bacterium]|nr:hypothetical protein [Armatimonadota bacterium]